MKMLFYSKNLNDLMHCNNGNNKRVVYKHKMNDMYSERDMPSATDRKKSLLEYAKTINIKSDSLESVVEQIVLETPVYSYTGYYASNYGGERYKLRAIFSLNEIKNK